MKKRKQHYVWEHYLKGWAIDGMVWCRRGDAVFRASTEKIANERDFYRLREMSERDFQVVVALIERMDEPLRAGARGWIPHFRDFHAAKRAYEASGQKNSELEAYLDEVINNLEEDLHAGIERNAIPLLAALRTEDTSLLEDDDSFIHFARFIAAQQMRTPRVRRRSIEGDAIVPGFNAEAAFGLMRTIFATNVAFSFFQRRRALRLTFLNASPSTEFITGDQPIINTRVTGNESDTPPTELELYYPLMPERALLLDFTAGHARESRRLTDSDVDSYNDMLAGFSESQIYAKSESSLRRHFARRAR
jgi:hypothetical protein